MALYSVIQTGGKQYLVRDDETITVQKINNDEEGKQLSCNVLMSFDDQTGDINLGAPLLETADLEVISNIKGEKIRVAKFKAKVRYRKVRGFRAHLSTIKLSPKSDKNKS